ncbi:hypothetical protein ABS693_004737 [Escherichia coli]
MTNVGTPYGVQVMHDILNQIISDCLSQTASGVIIAAMSFLARKAWAWVSNNMIYREVESS